MQHFESILDLPWAQTFEKFLQSHPTNKEDHQLFLSVLNFLHCYIKITASGKPFKYSWTNINKNYALMFYLIKKF